MSSGQAMVAVAIPNNLPADSGRRYLAVIPVGTVTITIGGGEPFSIAEPSVWAPIPACITEIDFVGTGTLVTG
jgi:hypothetical protein